MVGTKICSLFALATVILSSTCDARAWHFNINVQRYQTYDNETYACSNKISHESRKLKGNHIKCFAFKDGGAWNAMTYRWHKHFWMLPVDYFRHPSSYGYCTIAVFESSDCTGEAIGLIQNANSDWQWSKCHGGYSTSDGYSASAKSLAMECCPFGKCTDQQTFKDRYGGRI